MSLLEIHFTHLEFGKKTALLLSRTLPFFEMLKFIKFSLCSMDSPGVLLEAVDHVPTFELQINVCSGDQGILHGRFMKHRNERTSKEKGYIDITDWSVNSKLQKAIGKHLVSMIEKCSRLKLSRTMITKVFDVDSIFVGNLQYIL